MQYNVSSDGELVPLAGQGPQAPHAPQPQQQAPAPDFMANLAKRAPKQMSLSRGPLNSSGGGLISANGAPMPASAAAASDVEKVGRNDVCPCGSGKKYKKCHGA